MAFKGKGKFDGGKAGKFDRGNAGGTGGKFDEEDRSGDWYCSNCQERNFRKRQECNKCRSPKPPEGQGGPPPLPANGCTLSGMVKSYNRKGFGFIMCLNGSPGCQDIYYSRENLHTSLQTRDIPGEHVTFEIQRFHDGKLVAKNVRPVGVSLSAFHDPPPRAEPAQRERGSAPSKMAPKGGRAEDEDRSRDWVCPNCKERNFVKRHLCYKCQAKRPPQIDDDPEWATKAKRSFSPHAGARAIKEQMMGGGAKRARSGSASGSSSASSSRPRKKKKKKKKGKRRSSSSSSSRSRSSKSSKSSGDAADASTAASKEAEAPKNPEVEKAKADSLQKLMKLKTVEPIQARMKEYRELLRQWHPDKNPDNIEVATAVFQFLQKAKPMIGQEAK